MNIASILLTSAPLVISASLAVPAAVQSSSSQPQQQPSPQSSQSGEALDARAWQEKLATPSLDERERAFAELVDRAVSDDAAREKLRAWSKDYSRPDLAWSARLALREVERRPATHLRAFKEFGNGAADDLRNRFEQLEDRFGGLDAMFGELQRDLDRMFSEPNTGRGLVPGAAPRSGGHARSESFRMQAGPDGVKIDVDEEVDGKRSTRTYTGKSVDEILQTHPELADRIGLESSGAMPGMRGFSFRPSPGTTMPRGLRTPDDDDRWSTPARPIEPGGSGKTRTDILGIQYTKPDQELRERIDLEENLGMQVERVEPNTIAAALGLQVGDVIVALNKRPLREREDVVEALRNRGHGEAIQVEVVDGQGRHHTLTWNET